jgi:hypothetical protein
MLQKINSQTPKVLFIDGNCFSHYSNVGILKSNLFSSWSNKNLCQIVTSGEIRGDCTIPTLSLNYVSFFSLIFKNVSTVSNNNWKIKYSMVNYSSFYIFSLFRTIRSHFLRSFVSLNSNTLESFLKENNPDIIVTFGYTLPELNLAYRISKKYKIPLIMYFTDDYINSTYKNDFFLNILFQSYFNKLFLKSIKFSKIRITVSDKMNHEYKKRYKFDFFCFSDGINLKNFSHLVKYNRKFDKIYFSYYGGFTPDRISTFLLFAKSIYEFNLAKGFKIFFLKIYTFPSDKIKYISFFESYQEIIFKDFIEFKFISDFQKKSDILLHVESFDKKISVSMTKFSISTKIFQYVASGRPIFSLAPSNLASIEFLRFHDLSIICNKNSINDILFFLKEIYENFSFYSKYYNKNVAFSQNYMDINVISNNLKALFIKDLSI